MLYDPIDTLITSSSFVGEVIIGQKTAKNATRSRLELTNSERWSLVEVFGHVHIEESVIKTGACWPILEYTDSAKQGKSSIYVLETS